MSDPQGTGRTRQGGQSDAEQTVVRGQQDFYGQGGQPGGDAASRADRVMGRIRGGQAGQSSGAASPNGSGDGAGPARARQQSGTPQQAPAAPQSPAQPAQRAQQPQQQPAPRNEADQPTAQNPTPGRQLFRPGQDSPAGAGAAGAGAAGAEQAGTQQQPTTTESKGAGARLAGGAAAVGAGAGALAAKLRGRDRGDQTTAGQQVSRTGDPNAGQAGSGRPSFTEPSSDTGAAAAAVPPPASRSGEDTSEPEGSAAELSRRPSGRSALGAARRTRKARLRLSQVDPWSVMKTAFLFSVAAGIVLWVATGTVWAVIGSSGLFDEINKMVGDVIQTPGDTTPFRIQDYINTNKVMGTAALIAVIDVVIFTALATLGAFLYNLASAMIGGLEVTLAED
ncbi:transmembrane protein DUF3566 [Propionibacteriaceae bacterium ES.041]|uniref:DUF3566 domain-containing protein n=1 Tax=Enemella evansiae TaxID=2016499 RepID=UPI000B9799BA|nr:DUF3566 domain-containing protein [Enemella evansiae]OYO02925.1 hypothetical protein CGZ96_01850 [Enemella evansiae]PFG69333.1 transmembrane protein DUF3566 [Propionibacteriaceae bacterium ES.041]